MANPDSFGVQLALVTGVNAAAVGVGAATGAALTGLVSQSSDSAWRAARIGAASGAAVTAAYQLYVYTDNRNDPNIFFLGSLIGGPVVGVTSSAVASVVGPWLKAAVCPEKSENVDDDE